MTAGVSRTNAIGNKYVIS